MIITIYTNSKLLITKYPILLFSYFTEIYFLDLFDNFNFTLKKIILLLLQIYMQPQVILRNNGKLLVMILLCIQKFDKPLQHSFNYTENNLIVVFVLNCVRLSYTVKAL